MLIFVWLFVQKPVRDRFLRDQKQLLTYTRERLATVEDGKVHRQYAKQAAQTSLNSWCRFI